MYKLIMLSEGYSLAWSNECNFAIELYDIQHSQLITETLYLSQDILS